MTYQNTALGATGAPDCNPNLPAGFDPDLYPIIAKHWFGVHPTGLPRFGGDCVAMRASNSCRSEICFRSTETRYDRAPHRDA